jgi:hypothetical protein
MKRSDDFFDLLSQFRTVARAGRNRHHLEMSPLEMSPVVVPQQSDDLRSNRMLVEIRRDIGDPNSIVAVSRPSQSAGNAGCDSAKRVAHRK